MITLKGHWQDGSGSARFPALLEIAQGGRVELVDLRNGQRTRLEIDTLKVSSRLGQLERQLVFSPQCTFLTFDNDGVDQGLPLLGQNRSSHFLSLLERRLSLVLGIAVVMAGVFWGFFSYGLPWGAERVAQMLPVETEQAIGEQSLAFLDRYFLEPSTLSEERKQGVLDLFAPYLDDYPEFAIKVEFRSGMGPNALALPSGTLIFTDDLVRLAKADEELLAILGHEIGHVVERHTLRGLLQDSVVLIFYTLLTGDASGGPALLVAAPTFLLETGYSRDFEREADDFAYRFLLKNQISPLHFANIMQRMSPFSDQPGEDEQRVETLESFLSTHPTTRERVQRFKREGPDEGGTLEFQ